MTNILTLTENPKRMIYIFVNVCPFDNTVFAVSGKVEYPVNRFKHTSCMAVVSPSDRP